MAIARVIAPESVTAAAAAVQRAIVTTRASRANRGHCIQKLARIGVLRLLEDLVCRSALNDLAFMHHQDLVSYAGDARSWLMKMGALPRALLSSSSPSTCACTVTSRAVVGSSAIRMRGSTLWSRTLAPARSCKRGHYGSDGNIK